MTSGFFLNVIASEGEALSRTLVPYLIRDDTGNLREERALPHPEIAT